MFESETVTTTAWVYNGDESLPLLFVLMFACTVSMLVSIIYLCTQCCVCSESNYHHSNESSKRSDNSIQTIKNNSDSTSDSYDSSY